MYNKCSKCSKQIELYEERKLVLNSKGEIITLCMPCYGKTVKADKMK